MGIFVLWINCGKITSKICLQVILVDKLMARQSLVSSHNRMILGYVINIEKYDCFR